MEQSAVDATSAITPGYCGLHDDLLKSARHLLGSGDSSPMNELPLSQVRCLSAVAEEDDLRMAQLANRLSIKLPAASRVVHRLERRGLVRLTIDSSDRRVVRVSLSPSGRAMYNQTLRHRISLIERTLRTLPAGDVEKIRQGLALLCSAVVSAYENAETG